MSADPTQQGGVRSLVELALFAYYDSASTRHECMQQIAQATDLSDEVRAVAADGLAAATPAARSAVLAELLWMLDPVLAEDQGVERSGVE